MTNIEEIEKSAGYYFGTEIDGKWWKRYTSNNMFARGSGEYWFTDEGIFFHRFFTREPLFIAFDSISAIKFGKWHSGRWGVGQKVFKVIWKKSGLKLSSGFIFAEDANEVTRIRDMLSKAITRYF